MQFNGVDFSNYVVVEHIKRKFLPEIRHYSRLIPGRDGELYGGAEIGINTIEVDIRLIHDTRIDMQERAREVAGLLYNPKNAKLILRDDPTRYNIATIEGGADLETYLGIGLTHVTFVCYDPIAYSIIENEVGLPSTILYDGTRPTRGVVTATMTSTRDSLEVKNLTTGEFVKIEYDLQKDDIVTIDFINENVVKDGVSINKGITFQSDFFDIKPGPNNIQLVGATGNIKYRRRWI